MDKARDPSKRNAQDRAPEACRACPEPGDGGMLSEQREKEKMTSARADNNRNEHVCFSQEDCADLRNLCFSHGFFQPRRLLGRQFESGLLSGPR